MMGSPRKMSVFCAVSRHAGLSLDSRALYLRLDIPGRRESASNTVSPNLGQYSPQRTSLTVLGQRTTLLARPARVTDSTLRAQQAQ